MQSSAYYYEKTSKLANDLGAVNLGQGYPSDQIDNYLLDTFITTRGSKYHQYSTAKGQLSLRQSISQLTQYFTGIEYSPESEIVVTSGCTEALACAILGIGNKNTRVITFSPYFNYYKNMADIAQKEFTTIPLKKNKDKYFIVLDHLEKYFINQSSILILNNPHNPTGWVPSDIELNTIAELCEKHDITILSDEVYQHLNYKNKHRSIASINQLRKKTIITSSISKLFATTGWRIGWATGPKELIEKVNHIHTNMSYCAATPLQNTVAMGIDYYLRNNIFDSRLLEYQKRRDFLMEGLSSASFTTIKPDGGFFIVAGISSKYSSDTELSDQLIRVAKVAALPMSLFGEKTNNYHYLRFSFCRSLQELSIASDRLIQWSQQ